MLKNIFRVRSRKVFFGILIVLTGLILIPLGIYLTQNMLLQPQPPAKKTASSNNSSLGQPMWNGASSLLFGTNDTVEWSPDNMLTDPHHIIIPSLTHAHFGLIRSFFFHYSIYGDSNDHRTTIGTTPASTKDFTLEQYKSPAPQKAQLPGNFYEIEKRVSTIEQVGATCLGVLPSITTDTAKPNDGLKSHNYIDHATGTLETDLQFAEKVVAYLGNRCNLYEFGNEPDFNGIDEPTYVQKWNEFIPRLKAINPNAKFIGPVTASNEGMNGSYMLDFLHDMAAGKVNPLPDAISFHGYPCLGVNADTQNKCFDPNDDSSVFSYTTVINKVRSWMQQILGYTLPLGISEWNADPGSNPYLENASFMEKFTQNAINAMIDAHLDFAAQFDVQSTSGYCHLDMFDSCSGTDQPKAQFHEMANIISKYYPRATSTSAPTIIQTGLAPTQVTITTPKPLTSLPERTMLVNITSTIKIRRFSSTF
jgi:hypothetical protein